MQRHILGVFLAAWALQCVSVAAYTPKIPKSIKEWDYGLHDKTQFEAVPARFWDRELLRRAEGVRNLERLKGVVAKLQRGEPITVIAAGSSIVSDRGGCWHQSIKQVQAKVHELSQVYQEEANKCEMGNSKQGFLRNFMYMLNKVWPNPNHLLLNLGKPGAGFIAYVTGTCLENVLPSSADLVLIEHHHAGAQGESGQVLEQLLWRLHAQFKSLPAIVLMNSMRAVNEPRDVDCLMKQNCSGACLTRFKSVVEGAEGASHELLSESQFNALASFYGLHALSLRSWFHQTIRDEVHTSLGLASTCDYFRTLLADTIHQNHYGNVLMADLLVDMLRQAEESLAMASPEGASLPPIKPVLMPKHLVFKRGAELSQMKCYSSEGGKGLVIKSNKGWEKVVFQQHGTLKKYKPGYVASEPGSSLQIQVDTDYQLIGKKDAATVGLLYLTSYEHMGRASVRCVSGCTCSPLEIDAHDPKHTVSLQRMRTFQVTPSPKCVIEVQVMSKSGSGEHKFKLIQAITKGPARSAIHQLYPQLAFPPAAGGGAASTRKTTPVRNALEKKPGAATVKAKPKATPKKRATLARKL